MRQTNCFALSRLAVIVVNHAKLICKFIVFDRVYIHTLITMLNYIVRTELMLRRTRIYSSPPFPE